MALPIDKLDGAVIVRLNEKDKFNSISKEQILGYLSTCEQSINNVLNFFDSLDPQLGGMKDAMKKDSLAYEIYTAFVKQLNGTAGREEQRPFGAMRAAGARYREIAVALGHSMNDFVPGKTLTLFNTKVSHAAVLGLVKEAALYGRWMEMFCNTLMSSVVSTVDKPAPYVGMYLRTNLATIVECTNRTITTGSANVIIGKIKELAKNGGDVLLVSTDNTSNVKLARNILSFLPPGLVGSSAAGIAIFRWMGNRKFDKLDRRMRALETERQLLQAQVDLMKLKLNNIDETSPEYQDLSKIINNYTAMLARMERDLAEYYGE